MNIIYFSPHHKNKFVNSVNSFENNSLATLAETKKANMLDFTRSGPKTIKKSGAWIGAQLTILCSINRKLISGDYKEIGVRFVCSVWVSYSNKSKQISDSMNRGL